MPKFVRVNQLKASKPDVIENLARSGFAVLNESSGNDFETPCVIQDQGFDDLFIVPHKWATLLRQTDLVKSNMLVFHDKTSYLVSKCVQTLWEDKTQEMHVLDVRAGSGKINGFERYPGTAIIDTNGIFRTSCGSLGDLVEWTWKGLYARRQAGEGRIAERQTGIAFSIKYVLQK
jgi:hypothetical protein